jgi:lysophospholipase L1-like esterase
VIDVDEPLIEGEWCGLAGTILTEVESRTGLGLSFIGQNAWRTENHRHPSGDPAVPEIYQPAPYRGSYSDEALRRHVLAHESSHFMLMIGTNNGGEDHDAPERTVADVAAILDRIRTVHAMARLSAPELEPPRFLLIAPYATTDANTFFPGYAEGLRTIASSAEDVGFIDLHRLVLERFGIWSAWQADLLVDGTHPSLQGSTTFASMLWRELSAAAGSPADLDRNGIVDGADFGLLLASWGCEDPGYADLDGDECVDGADVGLLLADWFGG